MKRCRILTSVLCASAAVGCGGKTVSSQSTTPVTDAAPPDAAPGQDVAAGCPEWTSTLSGVVAADADVFGVLGVRVFADANGVAVAGPFSGTMQAGNLTTSSAGQVDVFMARYDCDGNVQWLTSYGASLDDYALAVGQTASGDTVSTAMVDGVFTVATTSGADGAAKTAESNPIEMVGPSPQPSAFARDGIAVSGQFLTEMTFGGETTLGQPGPNQYFGLLSMTGRSQWVRSWPIFTMSGLVAASRDGDVLLAQSFTGRIDVGERPFVTPDGESEYILLRMESNAIVRGVVKLESPGSEEWLDALAADASHVYVAGTLVEAMTFPGPRTETGPTTFVAALTPELDRTDWVVLFPTDARIAGLSAGAESGLFVRGYASDVGAMAQTFGLQASGIGDFVLRIDSSGAPRWIEAEGPAQVAAAEAVPDGLLLVTKPDPLNGGLTVSRRRLPP